MDERRTTDVNVFVIRLLHRSCSFALRRTNGRMKSALQFPVTRHVRSTSLVTFTREFAMTAASQPPQGLFFEEISDDFQITSQARTVTETDIVMFAGLTGDYNPLHTDEEYARQTLFGGRIAHGMLGLSLAVGLAWQLGFMVGTVEAFRELTWQFRKPTKIGDTL
ncbi:MAG: hypothetical protein C4345_08195, partial [Chloroflexota bacterium]